MLGNKCKFCYILFYNLAYYSGHLEATVAKIQSAKKLMKEARLKATRLSPVLSVLVTNISNEACREDKLKLYFKNKKKSGGGKCEVSITAEGQALVTFQEPESRFMY